MLTEKPFKEVMDSKLQLQALPERVSEPGRHPAWPWRRGASSSRSTGCRSATGCWGVLEGGAGRRRSPGLVNAAIGNPVERAARESVGKIVRLDLRPRFRRSFRVGDEGSKGARAPADARGCAGRVGRVCPPGTHAPGANAHARLGPLPPRRVPITKRVAYSRAARALPRPRGGSGGDGEGARGERRRGGDPGSALLRHRPHHDGRGEEGAG